MGIAWGEYNKEFLEQIKNETQNKKPNEMIDYIAGLSKNIDQDNNGEKINALVEGWVFPVEANPSIPEEQRQKALAAVKAAAKSANEFQKNVPENHREAVEAARKEAKSVNVQEDKIAVVKRDEDDAFIFKSNLTDEQIFESLHAEQQKGMVKEINLKHHSPQNIPKTLNVLKEFNNNELTLRISLQGLNEESAKNFVEALPLTLNELIPTGGTEAKEIQLMQALKIQHLKTKFQNLTITTTQIAPETLKGDKQ